MSKWTILAVALACGTFLLPSEASAGRYGHRHHRRACCCAAQPTTCCTASTVAAAPQMAQVPPAPGDSYQSFSYEPGGVVPAPTDYSAAPVTQSSRPHYLSGSFKALGNYGR